jgi:homoserine dehydrogenase
MERCLPTIFLQFKHVIKNAKKLGYFNINPVEDLKAKTGQEKGLKIY